MKIIEQAHKVMHMDDISRVEVAGRTCYKSEDKITEDSADKFAGMLIKRGHEAMIEHGSATVHFLTNRGVTHELVRHRLCAFGQESTRYVKYDGDTEFILPTWMDGSEFKQLLMEEDWSLHLFDDPTCQRICHEAPSEPYRLATPLETIAYAQSICEMAYKTLIDQGWRPEQAREVLPNSLKTEIVVSANFREWRHIFKLRAIGTTGKPHPQMQALMLPVLGEFAERCPAIFGDILAMKDGK